MSGDGLQGEPFSRQKAFIRRVGNLFIDSGYMLFAPVDYVVQGLSFCVTFTAM